MDNAPIHSSSEINWVMKNRNKDYKCDYLPLYSPELNPIEQFWVTVKHKVKHNQVMGSERVIYGKAYVRNDSRRVQIKE